MKRTDRVLIPDVLRAVAIICMLIAHSLPLLDVPHPLTQITGRINNVASPLFAVAMGMGAAIMLQRTTSRREALVHNVIRSAILVALGWWLATWGSWIAIVLGQLGLTLLIGTFLLLVPRRWLLALAIVIALAADPVNAWVARHAPETVFVPHGPVQLAIHLMFTNTHYRVTNLLPMFLFGAVLYHLGWVRSPSRRTCVAMVTGGVALNFVASLWLSAQPFTVSGSVPDTLADLGLVLCALGVVGLAATARQYASLLSEVALVGTVALSLYVVQVAVVALMADDSGRPALDGSAAAQMLAASVIVFLLPLAAWAWARWVGRGPVEEGIGLITGRYRHTS